MDRQCTVTGAFEIYYKNIKHSIKNFGKEVEKFGAFHTNLERITWICQLVELNELDQKWLPVLEQFTGKAMCIADSCKDQGNEAFKARKWSEALKLYSASYISVPCNKVVEKAIILANRSAALYHLECYSEALQDIKWALEQRYPQELTYKLLDRQARCYLALKEYGQAIHCFKIFVTSLDQASNLTNERRVKLHLDAMAMIQLLEQDPYINKHFHEMRVQKSSRKNDTVVEHLNTAISFDQNSLEGRYAKASKKITVGEEILVEKPYVSVLLEKYSQTHCQHCFQRTNIPVACRKCANVVFCSEKCLKQAASTYHRYECGLLTTLWNTGASINCHMTWRVFTMNSLEHFEEIAIPTSEANDLKRPLVSEIQNFSPKDYRRIAHLVSHQEKRSTIGLLQMSLMTRFLLRLLDKAHYFDASKDINNSKVLVGSLILHTLQLLQFNSHEVSELCLRQDSLSSTKNKGNSYQEWTVFIGGALYPTLALFNHSCDPSVVRYHCGNVVHVRTIKTIEAGLPISENYGPIYTLEERSERQRKLSDLYQFECTCDACLEDWPTFECLTNKVIRFRCDSSQNQCNAVIKVIPEQCHDFQIRCINCKGITNIFKGLKAMQNTESMISTGKTYYASGQYEEAAKKFVDLLRIMSEVLVPPFPDYCQCQQYLKDCFLHMGNTHNVQ